MRLFSGLLGQSVVKALEASAAAGIVEVGKDKISKRELAGEGCYNFHAARLLSRALAELKVASLKDLYERVPPTALAIPGLGVVGLAVLGAAFEQRGLGDLESWVRKH